MNIKVCQWLSTAVIRFRNFSASETVPIVLCMVLVVLRREAKKRIDKSKTGSYNRIYVK